MGYVGNQTSNSYSSMDKQTITGDGGASYTLTHAVANAQEIEVFVNNVRQEAGVAYTVNGTALSMTGNVASTDDFYVIYQGKALQTVVPPDGSVSTGKLANNAVTMDKLATSGTLPALDGSALTGIAQPLDVYNIWYRNKSSALSSGLTQLTVAADWTEESAKIGSSMSFDNGTGKWTFPSTGIWEITWHTTFVSTGNTNYLGGLIYTTTDDGSNFTHYASSYGNTASNQYTMASSTIVFDVTNTSTHKIRFGVEMAGAGCTLQGGSIRRSYGIFKRLGNT